MSKPVEPNICYCGAYGGGVHTRSARCRESDSLAVQIENVARWLANGCDVSHGAQELRHIAEKLREGATQEPAQQPIGFVARRKPDGAVVRDFALPGEQHDLSDMFEWMAVYERAAQPPGAGCALHGECPICKAERAVGDPHVVVTGP